MTNPDPEVVARLDALAARRFEIGVQEDALQRDRDVAVAALDNTLARSLKPLHEEARQIDDDIAQLIAANRSQLIVSGKKSFTITNAVFQFTARRGKWKIDNKNEAIKVLRRIRRLKTFATRIITWQIDDKKLLDAVVADESLREAFGNAIRRGEDTESLTMRPNSGFTVFHSSQRITPPSIPINRS